MAKFSAAELNAMTVALQTEAERRSFRSHHAFTKGAWHIIEPGTMYRDNWHLKAISDHLELASAGHIRLLIINIPPRHSKSIGSSVTWCPWDWGPNGTPHTRWLYAAYAGALAIRDSLKARRIIDSPWFQKLWGHQFQLTGDQNAKMRFENSKTGYRLATSVGGLGTGEGGDRVIVDDPHNVQDAESDAVRETTVDWWSKAMSTRLNDPDTGCHVVVMQRVHESDVTGYELAERTQAEILSGEVVHLCLPARFEQDRKCHTFLGGKLFFEDPRTKEGELLWPERFTDRHLTVLEKKLGEYAAAGQLQQRPAPLDGGILKVNYIKKWPSDKPLPVFDFILQSYDTALTEQTQSDYTACTVFGVFHEGAEAGVMIIDYWQEKLGYPALRKKVIEDWAAEYGAGVDSKNRPRKGRRADAMIVEKKGSGISLLQDLRLALIPAVGYNPGHADKIARAHMASPVLELGVIWTIESGSKPGEHISWVRPLIDQLKKFPNASHDDGVDTFTQGIIYIKNSRLIELPFHDEVWDEEKDYGQKKSNPYS